MIDYLLRKALAREFLTVGEALRLYLECPLPELALAADMLRREAMDDPTTVTWQIDRNVNITNVCISGCKFCNFHRRPAERDKAFVTTIDEYCRKIDETLALGGDQLLLQGGLHPSLGIEFYEDLFRELKRRYPALRLHALGPPEVAHIARISSLDVVQTLERLVAAGLDSLPGAGAEILVDDVRRRISPAKPSVDQWFEVMAAAHAMNLPTSATMMYGHIETPAQRIEHLIRLRDLHARRPDGTWGFTAFIPWIYHGEGTVLEREGVVAHFSPTEYLRLIAISRIVLAGVRNIQASWLTVGRQTAQLALHGGANDMGSIMIEENVVSSAGAANSLDANGIQSAIREAGFTPALRDQLYRLRHL
ncbi:MAG: CofH family radical SAM protein [Rikenellaceae bacterium]|jgi:cyclic dehypoxanthinyl futalosine synthase|nr:CofH family radical SAM protein [Rikenellaceae bacterium]